MVFKDGDVSSGDMGTQFRSEIDSDKLPELGSEFSKPLEEHPYSQKVKDFFRWLHKKPERELIFYGGSVALAGEVLGLKTLGFILGGGMAGVGLIRMLRYPRDTRIEI